MTGSTVLDPQDVDALDATLYAWDWSSTSHDARGAGTSTKELMSHVAEALEGDTYLFGGKGLQGWSESLAAYDSEGYLLGRVYFGGERPDVHCVSTSSAANVVRPRIVQTGSEFGAVKTARVDTCVDTAALTFEQLREVLTGAAGSRTKVRYIEGSVGGESTGRTLYIGSPSSDVQVRLYEKWLESPGQYEEGTNRVEVQLRPPSRSKAVVSAWEPAETFCASKLSRRLADALGADVVNPGTLQKSKGVPDLERTLHYMGKQYGKAARTWMSAHGGEVGTVLDHLLSDR